MQVVNCTTPASYFHVLRRQMRRNFRKPLVVMTPKSLLRHKRCVSRLADMGPGTAFHRVLYEDEMPAPDENIRRVVVCSGKLCYDLEAERALTKRHRIDALVTKASGGEATYAKIAAARLEGVPVVMIRRPPQMSGESVASVEEALAWLAARRGA